MKITVLAENDSGVGPDGALLEGEHGLSFFLETKEEGILLDAGKSSLFYENAIKLNIDLRKAKTIVLSHGHYDHGGGLETALEVIPEGVVYARENVFGQWYSFRGGDERYIGLNPKLLEKYGSRFVLIKEKKMQIAEGIYLLAHRDGDYSYYAETAALYEKTKLGFVPDGFTHEHSLIISTAKGLVVFNSCSHVGIVNVIRDVQEAFAKEKIYAVLGGFHFLGKVPEKCAYSRKEVREIADYVIASGIAKVYTGHCTGKEGFGWLKEFLGARIEAFPTGKIIEIEE